MTCAMLIAPHSNIRYFQSLRTLSLNELKIMSGEIPGISNIRLESMGGMDCLLMDISSDVDAALPILARHSSCQAIFELRDGWLRPLPIPDVMTYDVDIAAVLKYKGKTNERFTQLLINTAVFSGKFAHAYGEPLTILDPLCGRGTTLFQSLRLGYNATGIDTDTKDIHQLNAYIARYLEYHKIKHSKKKSSMTANGKAAGTRTTYVAKELTLQAIHGDTLHAGAFAKAGSFDALVADLPYGVQHQSLSGQKRSKVDALMRSALPIWRDLLKDGAAAVFSFNAHGITREALCAMLKDAGFTPLTEGPYGAMRHWVEQAVDRDIAVGIR